METLFSLPRPLQRRLTKMYTDTKSSYDFVKEPIQVAEDPELVSLHRKLRIQKDRLVSWGLEWSDPTQSPDIDESINKAGLSELVGSVMSTIKEILAEAEPLWQSSKRPFHEKGHASEKSVDRKTSLIVWDQSRFEDLVRDLTMSIDTLYDLSRTRQNAQRLSTLKSESSDSTQEKPTILEERQFESTRMQTPQQIDPASLIWPWDLKGIQPGTLLPAKSPRQIVFMRRPTSLNDARRAGVQSTPIVPVLLEHAPYDPIYSITGITPSMTRFEKLFAALSQAYISADRYLSGLLHLIGYFEEAEHSRFCLLFALPTNFGPVDIESPKMPEITILSELLYKRNEEPSLEVKYRLAYNVANAVFDLHAKGVIHGNVVSSNILFIEQQSQKGQAPNQINLRQSILASFDLFSDNAADGFDQPSSDFPLLHRHPLDPRSTRYTHLTPESKSLDLYSLAMLLLEIGFWCPLHDIFPGVSAIPQNPTGVYKQLAARCGSLFVRAVQACWHAPDNELSLRARPDVMHQKVFWNVSKALYACCAIDEVSDDESQSDDLPPSPGEASKSSQPSMPTRGVVSPKAPVLPAMITSSSPIDWSGKASYTTPTSPREKSDWSEKPVIKVSGMKFPICHPLFSEMSLNVIAPTPQVQKTKPKLRTYPSIRISQEHLYYWHTDLIPHINHALRGFYKKYPESVEISLESIGESPATAKPTILVICTSVHIVRNILKKSLVYDKTCFGLKVCRGKVVRSRKRGTRRSMANELGEDIRPANGSHQQRPSNGASIGAYVGERHLPPVSFGGLIMVDNKPYGMTVHHMLDEPDDGDEEELGSQEPILRSSGYSREMPDLTHSESSVYSSGDEEYMYDLTDYESDTSADDQNESDEEEDEDEEDKCDDEYEPGDIKGIPQGCGEEYQITQPAIDDVSEEFYPSEDTRDDDHLDSCKLGEVYASSGIRRRVEDGTVHEIDWALFEFSPERCPEKNCVSTTKVFGLQTDRYPLTVASSSDLSDLNVHCMARTSGLQSGRILPGMVIVKIYGRQTPSSSYQVVGKLGVPGDSGAWVVDNDQGRACGHVLAWSSRKKAAYICPMDILLRDIGETLNARSVSFPGGDEIYSIAPPEIGEAETVVTNLLYDLKLAPSAPAIHEIISPMSPVAPAIHEILSPISPVEEESGNEGDVPRYVPISLIEKSDDLVKVPGGKNYRFREIVENE
jgi:hypothetical protein